MIGEDVEISMVCFSKICSPISTKICLKKYLHLSGLKLADGSLTETGHEVVDILIGLDYFDIVDGGIIHGEKGAGAVSSKLGWILSGPTNDNYGQPILYDPSYY